MKSYQSYLFDLDGTLLDTIDLIVACFHHTFKYAKTKYGISVDITDQVLRRNAGIRVETCLQTYFVDASQQCLDDLFAVYRDFQLANWKSFVKVFDGGLETLESLKQNGQKIAIVTSRRYISAKLYCEELGLNRWIDLYVTPELTTHNKPHPEPALKAAELLGEAASKCLFIGDSVVDIQCALAAEMDCALVPWGALAHCDLNAAGSTYIIKRFSELLDSSDS